MKQQFYLNNITITINCPVRSISYNIVFVLSNDSYCVWSLPRKKPRSNENNHKITTRQEIRFWDLKYHIKCEIPQCLLGETNSQ